MFHFTKTSKYAVAIFYLPLLSLGLLSCSNSRWQNPQPPDRLSVSTFNLKFYGTGGGFNQPGEEPRDRYLMSFIEQELRDSDVVMFSEVVDFPRLKKNLSHLWDCVSYWTEESSKWHQHLALCYKPQKIRLEKYDQDWIIPEHRIGRRGLRPALQAKLCYPKNGRCFAQILGVHLKAGKETSTRMEQMETLTENFRQQKHFLPTIITGDFNSYSKERSGQEEDDLTLFEKILGRSGKTFTTFTRGLPTYNFGDFAREYDHVVASSEVQASKVFSYGSCARKKDPQSPSMDYFSYRQNFSDHCYLTSELIIH